MECHTENNKYRIVSFQLYVESKEQKPTNKKETDSDTENKVMVARWGRVLGSWVKKHYLAVTEQSQGCTVQHRDIVSNIVITVYCARWVLDSSGGSLCKLYKSLATMLYT